MRGTLGVRVRGTLEVREEHRGYVRGTLGVRDQGYFRVREEHWGYWG